MTFFHQNIKYVCLISFDTNQPKPTDLITPKPHKVEPGVEAENGLPG